MAKQEVVKKESNLPVAFDMEQDANLGFEEADGDSYAIPFLAILQKLSGQCDPDKASYIEGAKAGMFMDTVTNEVFDGEKGIHIIPCHYQRVFAKWVPRDEGGGFKGIIPPDSPEIDNAHRNESGVFVTDDGLELRDTRYHYVFYSVDGTHWKPALISLTSTQIKKSKKWMAMMQGLKIEGQNGPFTPPMFSHKYLVTSITESKGDDTWKGWVFTPESYLSADEAHLYESCKKFREQMAAGKVQIQEDGEEETQKRF